MTSGPGGPRHNREMLRLALWIVRIAGLAVVGLLTFLAPPSVPGRVTTQAIAYAVICAGVAAWGLAEFAPGIPATARRAVLKPPSVR